MNVSERRLLLKGAAGDSTAHRQIWTRWYPRILLYLKGSLPDEDCEDLCQEIMLKVFRSLKSYNPLWAPSTWIYTIAYRSRVDWHRRYGMNHSVAEDPALDEMPGPFPSPDETLIRKDIREKIHRFLERQEERDREILYLHAFEGMSGRQTARALGMPPETVRYRLKILKKRLKEVLEG
jgi:RNA polymerase sigma-70 factor (ECF subfamily)